MQDSNHQKILCLFAGYDSRGIIHDYVSYYLEQLSSIADVHYLADCPMEGGELDKIKSYVKDARAFRHGKYDFGSWQELLKTIGWEKVDEYDHVILCNDSCYGPLFPLGDIIESMNSRNIDFWGISRNFEVAHHLQSFFLCFNREVTRNASFRLFFENITAKKDVWNVILSYEVELTRLLSYEGFSHDAILKPEIGRNPTLYPKFCVRELGCPLVKVKCFSNSEIHLDEDIREWLESPSPFSSYPFELIRNHLAIVRPEWKEEVVKRSEECKNFRPMKKMKKILVHLHIFYHEQVPYFLEKLRNIPKTFDIHLVVTLVEQNSLTRHLLETAFPDVECLIVPNNGYDIAPFFTVLQHVDRSQYDLVLKLHTKGFYPSAIPIGDEMFGEYAWRNALVDDLLGSPEIVVGNIKNLLEDNDIGMIGCQRLILSSATEEEKGLIDYETFYQITSERFNIQRRAPFHFIAGTMFMARMEIFSSVAKLPVSAFSPSTGTGDSECSLAHYMERFLGFAVSIAGFRIKDVSKWLQQQELLRSLRQIIKQSEDSIALLTQENQNLLGVIEGKNVYRWNKFVKILSSLCPISKYRRKARKTYLILKP